MGSLATVSDDVYEANINDIQAVQSQIEEEDNKEKMVWRTKSGTKYHSRNNCGNTDSSEATQITCYRHNDNNRNKAGK